MRMEMGGGHERGAPRNVFGGRLDDCSIKPMTGFFRYGYRREVRAPIQLLAAVGFQAQQRSSRRCAGSGSAEVSER